MIYASASGWISNVVMQNSYIVVHCKLYCYRSLPCSTTETLQYLYVGMNRETWKNRCLMPGFDFEHQYSRSCDKSSKVAVLLIAFFNRRHY